MPGKATAIRSGIIVFQDDAIRRHLHDPPLGPPGITMRHCPAAVRIGPQHILTALPVEPSVTDAIAEGHHRKACAIRYIRAARAAEDLGTVGVCEGEQTTAPPGRDDEPEPVRRQR